jgi:aldehyde:ferredoxin oxidoreductase
MEDTDGIELTWGNHKAIIEILKKIGKREGFGAVLADGSKKASERIGKGSERFVVHCCKQEPGMHDPRVSPGYLGDHICDSAPGRHTSGIKEGDVSIRTVDNFGLCKFHLIIVPKLDLAKMLKTVTGWDTDFNEVQRAGLRSAHLRQAFTSREGITPKDTQFQDCKRPVGDPPIKSGPVIGVVLDQDEYQKKVFEKMEWDFKTGKPLKTSLDRVGLERVAKALWQ